MASKNGVSAQVLWKSCNQIPLDFKVRFTGDSQCLYQIPRLGSLMWDSEPSQQGKNFFGIIVLKSVVTHPAGMGFDFIMIVPLLLSCYGFFFVFGNGVSSLGRFSILLSMAV